jgi:rhodanese-related sulfurtransferase
MLMEKGYKDVKEMDQGYSAWQKAAYPVVGNTP